VPLNKLNMGKTPLFALTHNIVLIVSVFGTINGRRITGNEEEPLLKMLV